MKLIEQVRHWMVEPGVRSLDVDGVEFSAAHRRVILRKPMVRAVFARFYRECWAMDERFFGNCPGLRLELGSGSSIIKEFFPEVITSDIKPLPWVDKTFSADDMPFPAASLRAVYGINLFHHLPDPSKFFAELLRVLHPGGGAVLIEPYYGPLARWLFRRLHRTEGFDTDVPNWEAATGAGAFSGANQALSYIVFHRDRARFERGFPGLALVADRPHTHLSYLTSGGVNFRQLLPGFCTPLVGLAEWALTPLNRWLALQHTIVLRKECA